MSLSLTQEAARIDDLSRSSTPDAMNALNAFLDRVKRLEGTERDMAMDFNAKLITKLRERGVRLFDYFYVKG